MPQILMTHPQHGNKFALSETEAEHDEKFGWTRYTEATPAPVAPVAEEAPKRKYSRRVIEQPVEQPNGTEPVSDESEGN